MNTNLRNVSNLKYKDEILSESNKIERLPADVEIEGEVYEIKEDGKIISVVNTIEPGEKITEEQGNTPYTKNGTAVIPVGFSIVPGLDDVSEGLVITDTEGNEFVWIPVTNASKYIANTSFYAKTQNDTGYLPLNDVDIGIKEQTEEEQKRKLTFEKEKEMVTKKGIEGFYISRYETGKENTDTLVSKKNVNVWVNISLKEAKEKAKEFTGKDNTNVKSALASGVQWDMVMAFVDGKNDGENQPYDVTIASNSRHHDSGVEQSGQNSIDEVCNIYDLEGNCYEFVAEINGDNTEYPYFVRGGRYDYIYPASSHNGVTGGMSNERSFRLVLYVM